MVMQAEELAQWHRRLAWSMEELDGEEGASADVGEVC